MSALFYAGIQRAAVLLHSCTRTLALLTLVVPFIAAAAFPLLALIPKAGRLLAIGASVAAPYISLVLLVLAAQSIAQEPLTFSAGGSTASLGALLEFRLDSLSVLLAILTTFVSALSLTFSTSYLSPRNRAYTIQSYNRSYPPALLMTASLVGLYFSDNLLTLAIFWELAALCTYALVAFRFDAPSSTRAGLKALLMTHVGGVGIFVATLLTYTQTGIMKMPDYAALDERMLYTLAALALFAALPKAEQYPLYTWLLDGTVAPTPSIVIFSVCGFQASIYLLSRLLQLLHSYPLSLEPLRMVATSLGAITILAGGVSGLVERNLKRAIAYAKVAGMGFVLIGLGLVTPAAFSAALVLVVSHALAFTLLFLGAGSVVYATGEEELAKLGGLYQRMRLTAISFLLGCLVLASVPSTPEFVGKYLLFQASLEAGYLHLIPVIVLGSLLNAAVGARLFYSVFLGGERRGPRIGDPPPPMLIPMVIAAAATLLTGAYPRLVLEDWALPVLSQLGFPSNRSIYESLYAFAEAYLSLIIALLILALAVGFATSLLSEEARGGTEGEADESEKPFLCGEDMATAPLPGEQIYSCFLSAVKLSNLSSSVDPDRFHYRVVKAVLGLAERARRFDIHYNYGSSVLAFLLASLILLLVTGVLACW